MTNKQRREAYKIAQEIISQGGNGLCYALKISGFEDAFYSMLSCPEAKLFKPKKPCWYWLPIEDIQTRLIILDFCILMTKTKQP